MHIPMLRTSCDNNITVSTIEAQDRPTDNYETALLSQVRETVVVEWYPTREQAIEGHQKWCNKVESEGFDIMEAEDCFKMSDIIDYMEFTTGADLSFLMGMFKDE